MANDRASERRSQEEEGWVCHSCLPSVMVLKEKRWRGERGVKARVRRGIAVVTTGNFVMDAMAENQGPVTFTQLTNFLITGYMRVLA